MARASYLEFEADDDDLSYDDVEERMEREAEANGWTLLDLDEQPDENYIALFAKG